MDTEAGSSGKVRQSRDRQQHVLDQRRGRQSEDLRQKVYGAWNVYGTEGGQEIRALMMDSDWFLKHDQDSGGERRKVRVKRERSGCSPNYHSFI